ncbi:MAG TPA: tRNA preQ1(34) S-adenosylmethionine ribosyltransferase-isomerase QueA [Woeseiaceae bacterium]|nr:tRNA preQ1(34) S-adenosylmethionine ribosyltransferase-isomerase QueA [Woeseiaceae bacterium]
MLISDFDYHLPAGLIARHPTRERRASRLLEVGTTLKDRHFYELPTLLRAGDLLVFNDTRVIPARLRGSKTTGGAVEILIERVQSEFAVLAQVRASKSPKPGGKLVLTDGTSVTVKDRHGEFFELEFAVPVMPLLERCGEVPLPPYLEREMTPHDIERYQTVYARAPGAVAAPTAGLHFDQALLDETRAMGVRHAFVTLHVGAGTFQALRSEQVAANRLHSERVLVDELCVRRVNETRAAGGRVVCVGTTAVRALESASATGSLQAFHGETDLFILPGYNFHSVDAMLTNFHLPQSSLLMLVAAFAGKERVMAAYQHAVQHEYRFFSYGDSMFLTPDRAT